MDKEIIIYNNEQVISNVRDICIRTAMKVTKDTPGVIDTSTRDAASLAGNVRLINTVIDHELIRRYGA